jgi:phosphoribosyl 1,2-cyclic phosphodiesterase
LFEYPIKEKPAVVVEGIEPYSRGAIAGYDVLAVPAKHSVPTVGHQITSSNVQHSTRLSAALFYTGDTTVGISDCWQHISPQLPITEVAGPNKYEDWLKKAGHVRAEFLKEELIQFRQLKGCLPRVIVINIGHLYEQEIREEVPQELEADISPGYEDMKIAL